MQSTRLPGRLRVGDVRRLKRLIRYYMYTKETYLRMVPGSMEPNVTCWVDSDWADDADTRRSCSGGVLTLYGVPILTWERTQATPALSSCEAELYAMGSS